MSAWQVAAAKGHSEGGYAIILVGKSSTCLFSICYSIASSIPLTPPALQVKPRSVAVPIFVKNASFGLLPSMTRWKPSE